MSTLHCQRFNPVNYCQQANENKGLQAYHLSQLNKWVIMHCQFVCIGPHELNSKLVSKLTMQPDLSLSNNYQIFSLDHVISFTNRNNEIFNLGFPHLLSVQDHSYQHLAQFQHPRDIH